MRIILIIVAALILVVGLLMMVLTPIPGGAFVVALGLTLLICSSEWTAICICKLRSRIAHFNSGMTWLEARMGEKVGSVLRRTRPSGE